MNEYINFLTDLKSILEKCNKSMLSEKKLTLNPPIDKKQSYYNFKESMSKIYSFEIKYKNILDNIPDKLKKSINELEEKEKEININLEKYNDDNDKLCFCREMLWDVYIPLVYNVHKIAYKSVYNFIAKELVQLINDKDVKKSNSIVI